LDRRAANAQHLAALRKEWATKSPTDQIAEILAELEKNKTQYGAVVGKMLPVTQVLEELFKKIDDELAPPKPSEKKA